MIIICDFTSGKEAEEYYVANKCYKTKLIQGVAIFTDPKQAIKYADDYSCKEYKIEIMKVIYRFGADPYYNC